MSLVLLAGTEKPSPFRSNSTRPRSSWAEMFPFALSNGGVSSRRFTRCCTEPCARRETAPLIQSDARISFRIEHVSEKVDQHKDDRQEQNAALNRGQIALLDREQHVAPHAGPRKYRFGQDAARQVIAHIESQHRDDWEQREIGRAHV